MISTKDDLTTTCACDDRDADTLRALVAAGHDQWDASLALWSPGRISAAAVTLAGQQAAEYVRVRLVARLPWLRGVIA